MKGLISELTESSLVTSKTGYKKYSGKDIAELLYLHIIAYRILSCEKSEYNFIHDYSLRLKRFGSFKKWSQSSPDFYLLLLALYSEDELGLSNKSKSYLKTLNLDENKLLNWIQAVASRNRMSDIYARRLFITLDRQLKIDNLSFRSIRRLAMNWPDLDEREKKLTLTRLLQIMRARCNASDLLTRLERFARKNDLELEGVNDPEEKSLTLSQVAAKHRLKEDDGGGGDFGGGEGTTSADIAPMVVPMWGVYRRVPGPTSSRPKKKRKRRAKSK